MKPLGTHIIVYPNGTAHVQGVDYGPKVLVHSEESECLVLRVPGHMRWSGRGSQKYESPKLLVFLVERTYEYDRDPGRKGYQVRGLTEIDQGRKKANA